MLAVTSDFNSKSVGTATVSGAVCREVDSERVRRVAVLGAVDVTMSIPDGT